MFTEFEIGDKLWLDLNRGVEIESEAVQKAVQMLLRSYSYVIVRSHDRATEKVYESDFIDFEALMSQPSIGLPSLRSRQIKAQEFDLQ